MFGKIAKSLVNTAVEFADHATTLASSMAEIVGDWPAGDPIEKKHVVALAKAGYNMVEIASFFGVATRVIEDMLKDEEV